MEFNKISQREVYQFLIVVARAEHRTLSSEDLDTFAHSFGEKMGLSEEEIKEVIQEYKINEGVTSYHQIMIVNDTDDRWFDVYKAHPETLDYWQRYKKYLQIDKGLSPSTLKTMEEDIMRTISKFADPKFEGSLSKKGLVVGDVQSGKTANYIGLINMAVDAGYRNIVLLAGMTEDLRIQTQGRIDEGFIGGKSESFKDGIIVPTGIGSEGKHYGVSFTTTLHDFNVDTARAVTASAADYNKPVISVIKKNKSVITNLNNYISGNIDREELPLLIIDDECDNASINTQSSESPTAINEKIRELLSKYRIATYVGFSATPYANIFVDPDADYTIPTDNSGDPMGDFSDLMHVPDLFPDDFIILLEPPSDYVGSERLFLGFNDDERDGDQHGRGNENIVLIGDADTDIGFFPARHKRTDQFTTLCPSLKDAICTFILSSCVYSMRNHKNNHRSMLINISRFNDIQAQIMEAVKKYVADIKREVDAYASAPMPIFMSHPHLKRLKEIWENDSLFGRLDYFGDKANQKFSFVDLKNNYLRYEMSLLEVALINGTIKKKERFRYDDDLHRGVGARVIIVGGFALSRGLTLEGLMTSYYNRNASAYDVLLQMGRWFGYRHDYEDLVSVFMTQSSLDCFCAVTESTKDLKIQFRRMAHQNKTPREFGLMVREAPDTLENTLLITARNKSRNSEEYIRDISLSGTLIDTSKISHSYSNVKINDRAVSAFLGRLEKGGCSFVESEQMPGHFYYKDVPAALLLQFLDEIEVSYANNAFDPSVLIPFIRKTPQLSNWDVTFATGNDKSIDTFYFGDKKFHRPQRSFKHIEGDSFIRVGGSNNRLVDPGLFKIDLDKRGMEAAKRNRAVRIAEQNQRNNTNIDPEHADFTAKDLLEMGCRNPLLIIYPLDLVTNYDRPERNNDGTRPPRLDKVDPRKNELKEALCKLPLYGYAIGFPGSFKNSKTIYRINLIKKRALLENDLDESTDEDENYGE